MVVLVVPTETVTGNVGDPRIVRNVVAREAVKDARAAVTRNDVKVETVVRAAGTATRIAVTVTATGTTDGAARTPGKDPGGKHYYTYSSQPNLWTPLSESMITSQRTSI